MKTLRTAFVLLCGLFIASTVFAQLQSAVTIEKLLSVPFPSELVAAPVGGSVAWAFDAQGARNVWVAEPDGKNGYKSRQITHYTADDGQEITNIVWSPDAATLVFVRGGDANRQGEIPNPTNAPEPAEQRVWAVNVSGGEPVSLGKGSAPTVSPKGDIVVFLQGGQMWSASLSAVNTPNTKDGKESKSEKDEKGKAAKFLTIRGTASALRWSADGARLAFVSARGDHSFVGFYDLAKKTITYLDPTVDFDSEPVWSPDGKQLAFIRVPGRRSGLPFTPQREREPWSIRVADVTTGAVPAKSREIWRAERGVGSAFQGIAAEKQLFWTANERIVFPWERDGWLHLYSTGVKGGVAVLLTPGKGEVEHVALSADQNQILYSSNMDDINRRHIWRVDAVGGKPVQLTLGSGIEWSPTPISDGKSLAVLRSDARMPGHPAFLLFEKPSAIQPFAPEAMPKTFPATELVEPQAVILLATDSMKIPAQLFLPKNLRAGEKRPAIIFFHGGSRRQMLLGWHYMYYYHNAYGFNQYLANLGYIVLSVNYRSGIGYGMEFREALNYGAAGASEVQDVMGAGKYLQSRMDVDAKHIGLWGGSYGGYLTAMGLAQASDMFACGVDIHGVFDWNVVVGNFAGGYDSKLMQDFARKARESSPVGNMSGWKSPVLLIHGDDDRNVPFRESVDLAEALRTRRVPFEQLIFPDDIHDFLLHRNWLRAYNTSADFFDKYLKK